MTVQKTHARAATFLRAVTARRKGNLSLPTTGPLCGAGFWLPVTTYRPRVTCGGCRRLLGVPPQYGLSVNAYEDQAA